MKPTSDPPSEPSAKDPEPSIVLPGAVLSLVLALGALFLIGHGRGWW